MCPKGFCRHCIKPSPSSTCCDMLLVSASLMLPRVRAADRAEGCRMSGHMARLATPRSSSSGTTVWAENYHYYNKNTFLDVSFLSSHIYHPPPICLWHKYRIVVSYFDGISSYVWLPLISANDSRVAGQRRPRQPSFLALVSDLSHQNIGNVWIVRDR